MAAILCTHIGIRILGHLPKTLDKLLPDQRAGLHKSLAQVDVCLLRSKSQQRVVHAHSHIHVHKTATLS